MLFLFCFLSFSAMTGYKYYSFHRDIFCGSCRQFGRFSFLSGRDFCFVRLCFLFLRIFFSFCWDNFCAFSGKFVRNFYSICRFFYQPFRYFSVSKAFFLPILCRRLPCFSRNFDFSFGIFYILRIPPVVFLSAISAFFSSRSIFSACFVQAPAVFFPVILIFHLESFVFCGYCLPFFHLIPVFFVLLLNFFLRKSLFFSASASHSRVFFPHLSNHFQAFFRAVWEIFLSISIIFPLFSGLSGGNLSAIPVFFGFRSVFSTGLVQAFAVFFPRHPDFYPESFVFCGCCLPFFFQPYRYFGVSGAFFLPVLCRLLPCFSSVIPIFLRNLLRFTDAACRVFSSHTGTFPPFSAFPAYGKSPAFLLLYGLSAWNRRARIRTRVIIY
jgi:hypothetical protein